MNFTIRDATPDDAQAIAAIYAHYVLTSCATFEETPPEAAEMRSRMQDVLRAGLPYFIAETPGSGIAGYGYASAFHRRAGYRWTLEDSVYVRAGVTGQGIGTALLRALLAATEKRGYRKMVAVIGDSDNEASIRLHARVGFERSGFLPAAGFKLGRWVDVVQMQLPLGDGARSVPSDLDIGR